METGLPFEVYLFWVAVIAVIIICCVLLFFWGLAAIGKESEEQMLNVQGSMLNDGKAEILVFHSEQEAIDYGIKRLEPVIKKGNNNG